MDHTVKVLASSQVEPQLFERRHKAQPIAVLVVAVVIRGRIAGMEGKRAGEEQWPGRRRLEAVDREHVLLINSGTCDDGRDDGGVGALPAKNHATLLPIALSDAIDMKPRPVVQADNAPKFLRLDGMPRDTCAYDAAESDDVASGADVHAQWRGQSWLLVEKQTIALQVPRLPQETMALHVC